MKRSARCSLVILGISLILNPYLSLAQDKSPIIAFTSDTQAPMLVERILLKSNQNQRATGMIFNDIIATQPSALFILGDVVSLGYKNSKWTKMDSYLNCCSQKNIPVYAALGNHELMINAARGERNFQSRFQMHNPSGYLEIVDSVAVVLLNSNFSKMTDSAIIKQDKWYKSTIKSLDGNPAVKFVIVGCHHSPYTNSKIVAPSLTVQQKFVPVFIDSKKCVLFLSGHSHNYEHFTVKGKNFFVIGGGGGLHQPLHPDTELTHDLSEDYKPMFHYLEVKRYNDSLRVVSRRLKADFSAFDDGQTLMIGKK